MDQTLSTLIAAAVPTIAVIGAYVRNEAALAALAARVTSLETRLDARITSLESVLNGRIESLDRDLREWARIVMKHNTDIARLKDRAGLSDPDER